MTIRSATAKDLPALIDLGEKLHAESLFAKYSFDRKKVHELFVMVMKGGGVIFVSDLPDVGVVGGIAGGVAEHWFGHDLHGFDYSFFVEPEHRHGITAFRLLVAFEEWCKRRGATEMRIGITTGITVEATSKFYEWHGYQKTGSLFTKELPRGN